MSTNIYNEIREVLSREVSPTKSSNVHYSTYDLNEARNILTETYQVDFRSPQFTDSEDTFKPRKTIESKFFSIPGHINSFVEIRIITDPHANMEILFVSKFGADVVPLELRKQ